MNKLFIVEYAWFPSFPESSIVIAKTVEEALEYVKKEWGNDDDNDSFKLNIVKNPKQELRENNDIIDCRIREISLDEVGIIYTGKYCC